MPGLHSQLEYSSRLLARCERDEVRTNVDIHTLMRESSIMRQDIRDILVSFDSGLIYQHVSESFVTRWEQVESVEDETNIPFTLSFSSCLVLSQRECKSDIIQNAITRFQFLLLVCESPSQLLSVRNRCETISNTNYCHSKSTSLHILVFTTCHKIILHNHSNETCKQSVSLA